MPVEYPGLDVDEAMNSHGPAMFGIGAAGIFELEQLVNKVVKTNSRAETSILLMNTRSFISATRLTAAMTDRFSSVGTHFRLDGNTSAELWHPAKREFVNGALKFDE